MASRQGVLKFTFVMTVHFEEQVLRLPPPVYEQLKQRLKFMENNLRHPSLRTHEVKNAVGNFGGKIFEVYVNEKYRMTWEYGSPEEIILRNVDNHDECLRNP